VAAHVFDEVCLEGMATWALPDWTMVGFEVATVAPHKPVDLLEGIAQFRAAMGGVWDRVHVTRHLRRERAGGAP
jgi:hypothetical protein